MAKIRINGCGWWDKGADAERYRAKKALRFTTQHLEKENSKMKKHTFCLFGQGYPPAAAVRIFSVSPS